MVIFGITFSVGFLIFLVIIIALILLILFSTINENKQLQNEKREAKIMADKVRAELKVTYQEWAIAEFEKFKQTELLSIKIAFEEQYKQASMVLLQKWKIEEEAKIRQDAINRSYAVNLGKITEHLVPFHIKFPFNPKDVRFIGSPIDMIVFDGHSEQKDKIVIWIVEVKTGNSRLTDGQQRIKKAVLNAEIRWYEINPDDETMQEIVQNKISNTGGGNQIALNLD